MRWTTNVEDPSRIRDITARELKANTFPYDLNTTDKDEIKRGSEWLRYLRLVGRQLEISATHAKAATFISPIPLIPYLAS